MRPVIRVASLCMVVGLAVALVGAGGDSPTPKPPATLVGGAGHAAPRAIPCEACHTPGGWSPARFAHERTGFALVGRHQRAGCRDCHGSDFEAAIPTTCVGCHVDPHAQEFGVMCRSCHDEQGFVAPGFSVDAHRRLNFPLTGRHAALPCDECHVEKRERTFTRAALECASCHAGDAARASLISLDHTAASVATLSCRGCHEPLAFKPARLPQHERCFPIARGAHAGVRCGDCHGEALRGARATGACAEVDVRCAECHTHRAEVEDRHHADVPGYVHASARCAGCHRTP